MDHLPLTTQLRPLATTRGTFDRRPSVALLAPDHLELRLVDLAICYRDVLARHRLVATATTGRMLADMVGLVVQCVRRDRWIADAVVGHRVAAVIFLVDPLGTGPHRPRLDAVTNACGLRDVPLATNISTAGAVLHSLAMSEYVRAPWPSWQEK